MHCFLQCTRAIHSSRAPKPSSITSASIGTHPRCSPSVTPFQEVALPSHPPQTACCCHPRPRSTAPYYKGVTGMPCPSTFTVGHFSSSIHRSISRHFAYRSRSVGTGLECPSPLSLSLARDITPGFKRERVMTALPCNGGHVEIVVPLSHPSMRPSPSFRRLLLKARSLSTAFQSPSQPGSAPRSLHPGSRRESGVS